ncbi:hypothetical protein [Polaribacter sp. BM10]|nr:hypothetical protein [Polaribacter sp. BM10]
MSKKEKTALWYDLTDSQKNEIQQEVINSNKKKKSTWEDLKKELSKLK